LNEALIELHDMVLPPKKKPKHEAPAKKAKTPPAKPKAPPAKKAKMRQGKPSRAKKA
jgi:hypothetical protein